jgi:hypothetical protein
MIQACHILNRILPTEELKPMGTHATCNPGGTIIDKPMKLKPKGLSACSNILFVRSAVKSWLRMEMCGDSALEVLEG